jgi:hypothetical protein
MNNDLKHETEVQQSDAREINLVRIFFVCTVAKNYRDSMVFHNFDIKTEDGNYPTYINVLKMSDKLFPNEHNITLLSISEIPEADWEHFESG